VPFLQINGIAFDGISTLYTTNLSSGELLRVPIRLDGSAAPATVIDLDRELVQPDGIHMLRYDCRGLRLPGSALVRGTCRRESLGLRRSEIWRLLSGQPPVLPFKVRRLPF
jgi:hypothetical protein